MNDTLCDETNYVGNRLASSLDLPGPDHKTLREKYLIGEPRDCPIGKAAEMKRRGFVGIYEKDPNPFFFRHAFAGRRHY
jgi:hypothetical protein